MTIIPLSAIRDLSIGRYPGIMNPAGINFISVTYDEDGRQSAFSSRRTRGSSDSLRSVNALIQEWFDEIQAATVAATGRAPRTTPAEELGCRPVRLRCWRYSRRSWFPAGLAAIGLLARQQWAAGLAVGNRAGIVAAGLLLPFALALLGQRRRGTSRSQGGLRTAVMVVLAIVGQLLDWGF